MKDLDYLREKINEIDNEMVVLFLKRMDIVADIAKYKKENSKKVFDPNREKEILEKHLRGIDEDKKEYMKEFLQNLMDISKKVQKQSIGIDNDGILR